MRKVLLALKDTLKGNFFGIVLFAAVAVFFINGINTTSQNSSLEEARVLTQSINRGVITCYSIEGSYPQSLDYLCQKYGVSINEDKYVVYYDIFASNIMPQITVIER